MRSVGVGKTTRLAADVLRKRHTSGKTVAAHFAFLLKRHEFRWESEQRDKQLMFTCASNPKSPISDILF
jgi:hypothetical protein